jgi:RimJ/RimL family protein N-acetyltransferase
MPTPAPITTERLLIRALTPDDAAPVARLAGAFEVADMTLTIPHPYSLEDALMFLTIAAKGYETGDQYPMAITLRTGPSAGELVGAVGLHLEKPHDRAELGYWIGVPHWNNGYATEASRAMLRFGFEGLNLTKITAHYFTRNPASGRILEKLSMHREGLRRQHIKKWGKFEDIVMCALLRQDYQPHA